MSVTYTVSSACVCERFIPIPTDVPPLGEGGPPGKVMRGPACIEASATESIDCVSI